ncbi:MAG: aldose 1-epimerase [Solirubrobacteraceae bacterium]
MGGEGLERVAIRSADGELEAEFVPGANMLCCSMRHRGVELLYAGHGLDAYVQHGKTMGIPLLHPWANRLRGSRYAAAGKHVKLPAADGRYATDPNGLPIHGALPGLMRWDPEVPSGGDRIRARLDWSSPPLLELFPFAHELVFVAHAASARLTIETTLRATGADTVPVSFGYHPYLVVPHAPRQDWRVRLGAERRLILDAHMIPTGAREPVAEREFTLGDQRWDDGLDGLTSPPEFAVSGGDHRLAATFDEGFAFAQVFAPPGQDFICFEPMTAPTDALNSGDGLILVAPGGQHRATFTVTAS